MYRLEFKGALLCHLLNNHHLKFLGNSAIIDSKDQSFLQSLNRKDNYNYEIYPLQTYGYNRPTLEICLYNVDSILFYKMSMMTHQ